MSHKCKYCGYERSYFKKMCISCACSRDSLKRFYKALFKEEVKDTPIQNFSRIVAKALYEGYSAHSIARAIRGKED